jgi:chloride channel protein, CIC family
VSSAGHTGLGRKSDPTAVKSGTDGADSLAVLPGPAGRPGTLRELAAWLGGSRLGLVVMALFVGGAAGLGAVVFRELIYAVTWMMTGHEEFGQQGRVASLHFPGLGIWFLLLVPILGGLLYGPLVERYAKEARGHGVPEVMLAVAKNGGRIRPPVTIVKALASALCIGTGGSVGREGPIVQIGSAFASTVGQLVRMSESRLRVIVACGAAGGIAATFNAPLTGLFFGFEIVLREFSLEALLATALSAVTADLVGRAFFGAGPIFSAIPHEIPTPHDYAYLLIAALGLAAGLVGVGFKAVLYKLEDLADELWRTRPEWARPAVGGLALGAVLLALPQMYGVGYPVIERVIAGHYALWFIVILMIGKVFASSLTLSIGGSGGVFAPSLFTGAAGGMTFGVVARHLLGAEVGPAAMYAVIAMGGVFAAAAQAPLTAIASVLEMTANFTLTLPVMLAAGIAAALSKRLSYGSIYTTKLLRRGTDIERPRATSALESLTVTDVMHSFPDGGEGLRLEEDDDGAAMADLATDSWAWLAGPVTDVREPQALFVDEGLEQALRQLVLYGRDGLPVLSHDGHEVKGWITRNDVLHALDERVRETAREIERGARAADVNARDPASDVLLPSTPLRDHQLIELTLRDGSPATDQRLGEIRWPRGSHVVAVTEGREVVVPRSDLRLRAGDRIIVLAPTDPAQTPAKEEA